MFVSRTLVSAARLEVASTSPGLPNWRVAANNLEIEGML
jgi:hypothetical protein